ncbi:ROK family transcriptional regulator [Saliterribacillus persicus]|uniref:Putative NBD/HSP70 family sugar kinase n=1 Tax=Saliterribacillus persicus TaxID=930114 RepID=A0A368Y6C2_9BACI|nr:ROK family transcriptional regulator [Saliterribacillus persicus]RCW74898.1 putative NBD/HSP70 family sugar kinase [Saliterribacillus persicus]
MVIGDGQYIKHLNRSLILNKIIESGKISRADLSKITGLNKATISVQVANLLDEELIVETREEHTAIGRRPIMLSINKAAAYFLGIDLDYHTITYFISDLQGNIVSEEIVENNKKDYQSVILSLTNKMKSYEKIYQIARYGLAKITIGVHGTVNRDQSIQFIPKFKWYNVDIKSDIESEISTDLSIENNANLSAYAENVFHYHESNNLLNILLSSGIGAGIILDGDLHKGYDGHAGEMGHMIIYPNDKPCTCGNHGCWELYSSEPVLTEAIEEIKGSSFTTEDVESLLRSKDEEIKDAAEHWIENIAIGVNNIVNLYNPETIVINSKLLSAYPGAIAHIKTQLKSSITQYHDIVLSTLGKRSSAVGACAMGIQTFLEVPQLQINLIKEA